MVVFIDDRPWPIGEIEEWLRIMDITDCLEYAEITEQEVLEILIRHGYIEIPEWIRFPSEEQEETGQENEEQDS